MRGIVGFSLAYRYVVAIVAIGLLFFGFTQTHLRNAPLNVLPEFMPTYVEIQTEALGLSADEVEALITVPMEHDLLSGVPWVQSIRSESVPGLASIVLTFEPGTDMVRARQMVTERLTQAVALPHVSKPPVMLQPTSAARRGLMVALSAKDMSLIQASVLARWKIQPRLLAVPGVANVSVWGMRDRQLQVQLDPEKLRTNLVPLSQILETTGNALWVSSLSFVEASSPGTGGFIETGQQRLGVRHLSPIVSAEKLAEVPIADMKKKDGTPLRLADVGAVVEDHQPLIGDAVIDNGQGLMLVVETFPWANSLEVTRGIENALDEMRPGLPGVTFDSTVFRPASFIELSLQNLVLTLAIGALLLVLVVAALFFEWRTALIGLVAIALSLVAGGLVLFLRGETLNVMILAGFALAGVIVVDEAIVGVENIARRLRQHRGEQEVAELLEAAAGPNGHDGASVRLAHLRSTATVILDAAVELRGALIFATLINALTVLPIVFVGGLTGGFFQPLLLSYGLAVLAAMVVAVTATPALCLILLNGVPLERRESPLARTLQRSYRAFLTRTVQRPAAGLAALAIVAVLGLLTLPFLGLSAQPSFKERDLLVQLTAAPGTGLPEMNRIAGRMGQELRSLPGVRSVGAHSGRAVTGDQKVGVNSAEVWVGIDPAADYGRTVAAIRDVVRGYPGIESDVQTYLQKTGGAAFAAAADPVAVRIYGEDQEVLNRVAGEVQTAIAGVGGVVDPRVKLPIVEPTLEVEVDVAAAQRYGIKPGDVRRTAATLISGLVVGSLFEEQKVFDVVVWSTPETRHSLNSIQQLLIETPSGGFVRLGDLAKVRIVSTPNVIRRDAISRYVDVVANVQGRDLGAVTQDVQARLKQVKFPLEYHAEVLGDYADRQAARNRVIAIAIAAAIGIVLLSQAAFGSWRLAVLASLTAPAALAGGLLAALVTGGSLSLGALLGLVAVFAIAGRTSIVLISRYRDLERRDGEAFGPSLALRGAVERFSPIATSLLAMGLAFLPMAVAGEIPGLEILHPMAVVVVGGLITSALLNLFVVPVLYTSFAGSPARDFDLEVVPAAGAAPAAAAGS
jgi:CzcA family heavy metal efflux pump